MSGLSPPRPGAGAAVRGLVPLRGAGRARWLRGAAVWRPGSPARGLEGKGAALQARSLRERGLAGTVELPEPLTVAAGRPGLAPASCPECPAGR